MNIVNKIRITAALVSTSVLSALLAITVASAPAPAAAPMVPVASTQDSPPWVYDMGTSDLSEGLVIKCPSGENVTQCFIAYDYLGQPISGINSAGGALWWAGDFANGYRGNVGFSTPMLQMDTERALPPTNECLGLTGILGKGWWGEGGLYQCKVGGYGFYWAKVSL